MRALNKYASYIDVANTEKGRQTKAGLFNANIYYQVTIRAHRFSQKLELTKFFDI